jgi:hypothetical protein
MKFRCTRNEPYLGQCPGRTDLQARQGRYLVADSKPQALAKMAADFPQDVAGFTADEIPGTDGFA